MVDFLIYLGLWNLLVFITYGIDKRRAVRGQWRISEKSLLLIAVFFGGFGAFIAGKFFHHKTRKWYFQATWYLGMGLTLGLAYLVWKYLS
ncbi:DUF1294 domain-containing protein [Streptococcus loxodontisalivarius]|uniref:Uncharacterized membrane protein YsdA (DUF1294 family) n=1 Tax=Streptococcus loxodontisalivarius TaxID=1349415 RepID=A0ABS2PSZ2_9STRE|nr:DUF1294 domain-containing protein [Streptococcus loxodontisalivarius]MBM7643157.1 uncharacterized membrane protein YsdA (DUF1294 family) [Streptococcus loxodontisalivarius]